MVTCNDTANLFFVIVNNISYNKLEVENIIFKKRRIFKTRYRKLYKKDKNFKKERKIMKANIIKKGILILVVVSLLAIGFTGCTLTFYNIPGTVYISINESDIKGIILLPNSYTIYMDYNYNNIVGVINSNETLELAEVSLGYHTFEAWDTSGWYYGIVENRWIHSGINDVTISVHYITH